MTTPDEKKRYKSSNELRFTLKTLNIRNAYENKLKWLMVARLWDRACADSTSFAFHWSFSKKNYDVQCYFVSLTCYFFARINENFKSKYLNRQKQLRRFYCFIILFQLQPKVITLIVLVKASEAPWSEEKIKPISNCNCSNLHSFAS